MGTSNKIMSTHNRCFCEEIISRCFWLKKIVLTRVTGPSCSKLTTSLVNVSLKFQTLISQKSGYFVLKKCEKQKLLTFYIFSTKNISLFGNKVVKHLTS